MPIIVLFIIFVIGLVIAIPVSITLGITSVLPSVFDPSFTVGAKYLIRAMFGGLDSFRFLRSQCLSYRALLWRKAEYRGKSLIYLPIFLESLQRVCHAQ